MSDEKDFVIFVGNLAEKVTDTLLHELFLQAGPIEDVSVKKGFGFITFTHHESVPYTIRLFEGIQLYGKKLIMKPRDGSMYANMAKERGNDLRRSRSMNEFSQGSSFYDARDNRPHHNTADHDHNMKKVSSLTEIDAIKSRARANPSFNQTWSPGNVDSRFDNRNFERSFSFDQSGSANGSFNNGSPVPGQEFARNMDARNSSRNANPPHYERSLNLQGNSYGNRGFKNSPNRPDSGNSRDVDMRHSTPNRRDSQYDRSSYYDKKNFNHSRSFDSSNHQDNWSRNSGNFGSPSQPAGVTSRFDHGPGRPHHDKPYGRPPKYSNEDYSKGNMYFGNGNRRH